MHCLLLLHYFHVPDFGTLSVIYGQPAVNWLQKEQLDEWHTVTDPAVGVDGVNSNPPPPPAASTPSQQPQHHSSIQGGSGGGGGGDLLDLSEYGFVVPTPIALDPNASITPEMYQECWLALQDGHTSKYAVCCSFAHPSKCLCPCKFPHSFLRCGVSIFALRCPCCCELSCQGGHVDLTPTAHPSLSLSFPHPLPPSPSLAFLPFSSQNTHTPPHAAVPDDTGPRRDRGMPGPVRHQGEI
jgi:hypothetical protein